MKTDWQKILQVFQPHIHHKRYGLVAQKMIELVERLSTIYADTNVSANTSLFTLMIGLPSISKGLDIIWYDEEQAYHVCWMDGETIDHDRFVPENEIIDEIDRFIRLNS